MTYRANYELTTPTLPAWRRFGLWLNPQRWWFARKARGGHWVCYVRELSCGLMRHWTMTEKCNGERYDWEHEKKNDKVTRCDWFPVAHEDHGEVWG